MATNASRIQSLFDALLNKTATAAQMDRVGVAIAYNNLESAKYAAMTQGEKAGYVIEAFRQFGIVHVKRADADKAAVAAAATNAGVDTEFTPAP